MTTCLKDRITRWRHTRGYGVHSPLAYSIVKECIRPQKIYGFYSDAYLEFEFHEDRKGLRNAKMTLRLVNLLRPARIWMPAADRRLTTALGMSFPDITFATSKDCPKNVDLIITSGAMDLYGMWGKMAGTEECAMIIFGKLAADSTSGWNNPPTMELAGREFTILLRRSSMDYTHYLI
ncbi:MAG: hypothetical protein K2K45_07995 [Muribaculaceae bacterium]|nr:hypothetical protein [Muribaculaceae bacterium]